MARPHDIRAQLEQLKERLTLGVYDPDQATSVLHRVIGQLRELEEDEERPLR